MSSIEATTYDFTLRRYRTFADEFEVTDLNDNPVDLSGYTITAQIREKPEYASKLIHEITVDVSQASIGIIGMSFTVKETSSIKESVGYWDMLFDSGTGDIETWFEGVVNIKESITHV